MKMEYNVITLSAKQQQPVMHYSQNEFSLLIILFAAKVVISLDFPSRCLPSHTVPCIFLIPLLICQQGVYQMTTVSGFWLGWHLC